MTDKYTALEIQEAMSRAIQAGDMEAVAGLIYELAKVDPEAAELIIATIKAGQR